MKATIKEETQNQKVISVTEEKEKVKNTIDTVIGNAIKNITVEGFRKGKAPQEKAKAQLDQTKIINESINLILPDLYKQAVEELKLKPITDPKIEVVKFSETEGLEINITVAEKPEIDLKNYKKNIKGYKKPVAKDLKKDEKPVELSAEEKTQQLRGGLLQELVNGSDVKLAELLVEQETNRMLTKLSGSLERMNITVENFLKSQNKKVEDIREEYFKIAEQNLKSEFVLNALGQKLEIKVEDTEIDNEINNAPDENTKKELEKPENRWYIEGVIFTRKVLDKIEEIYHE